MKLERVVVAYPSGNTTAIVFDSVEQFDKKKLNSAICTAWAALNPAFPIEQCCSIQKPAHTSSLGSLKMFGGEFCGNATRSVVYVLSKGENSEGFIETSGVDAPLSYKVHEGIVSIGIPFSNTEQLVRVVEHGYLVRLDGIVHIVQFSTSSVVPNPRELLTKLLNENTYTIKNEPAVGVSIYNPTTGIAAFCVWVQAVDTIFDETACGSGTASIGIAYAFQNQKDCSISVRQPSTEAIQSVVSLDEHGCTSEVSISGSVRILYDGPLELPEL